VTALVIAVVSAAVYLVGFVRAGRWMYARKRPFTEPLSCEWQNLHSNGDHCRLCYMRPNSLVGSNGEALALALLTGFGWPLVLLGLGALRLGQMVFARGVHPLAAERDAKTARLEREMGIGDRK
jgi:hypothetical protein